MLLLSVIIPVYNAETYLYDCLESVVHQKIKDMEIICVNDGSTDKSLDILSKYSKIDRRIVVVSQENKGQSVARNVGLSRAQGKYIYFMDADDIIALNCFSTLLSEAEKYKLDMLCFNADVFFESRELKNKYVDYVEYYQRKKEYNEIYIGTDLLEQMTENGDYLPSPCLQLIQKDLLTENRIKFKEGIIHEDNLFTFLCMMHAQRAKHIGQILYHRRIRKNSTMTQEKTARNTIGYFVCFIEMLKFALMHEKNSEGIKKQITTTLRNSQISYRGLNEQEKNKIIWADPSFEKFMFDLLVKEYKFIALDGDISGECLALKRELINIYSSKAYKIGKIFTYIPRKFHSGIRCIKENGLRYTVKNIKKKIFD